MPPLAPFVHPWPWMGWPVDFLLLCVTFAGLWKVLSLVARFFARMTRKIDQITAALPTLLAVSAHFKANGGTSLWDVITAIQAAAIRDADLAAASRARIEITQARLEGFLDNYKTAHADILLKVDRLESHVIELSGQVGGLPPLKGAGNGPENQTQL